MAMPKNATQNATSRHIKLFFAMDNYGPHYSSLLACGTRVCSAERCRQLPKWAVLSHIKCLSQREVVGFQVVLHSLESCDTWTSWRPSPTLRRSAHSIFSASMDMNYYNSITISRHVGITGCCKSRQDVECCSTL